jgi:prefoldin subunit 5
MNPEDPSFKITHLSELLADAEEKIAELTSERSELQDYVRDLQQEVFALKASRVSKWE